MSDKVLMGNFSPIAIGRCNLFVALVKQLGVELLSSP